MKSEISQIYIYGLGNKFHPFFGQLIFTKIAGTKNISHLQFVGSFYENIVEFENILKRNLLPPKIIKKEIKKYLKEKRTKLKQF